MLEPVHTVVVPFGVTSTVIVQATQLAVHVEQVGVGARVRDREFTEGVPLPVVHVNSIAYCPGPLVL